MKPEAAALVTKMLIGLFSGIYERAESKNGEELLRCLTLGEFGKAIIKEKNDGAAMPELLEKWSHDLRGYKFEDEVLGLVPIAYEQDADSSEEDFKDMVIETCRNSIENK